MNIKYLTKKIKGSDMSLSELSRRSNVSRQTFYNIMEEIHFPELDKVVSICKALGLDGTELAIVLGIKEEE